MALATAPTSAFSKFSWKPLPADTMPSTEATASPGSPAGAGASAASPPPVGTTRAGVPLYTSAPRRGAPVTVP